MSDSIVFSAPQTLTTLHVSGNEIGDEGAEHLTEPLKSKKVRQIRTCLIPHIVLFFLPFRHSPHSMWVGMVSQLKILNIWRWHYDRLK